MAKFRVRCPTCNAELELDEAHAGKEVECGSCLQVFTAPEPGAKKKPYKARPGRDADEEEERPSRRRRPRRDDYDEYDYSPPSARGGDGGSTAAVFALILGILSLPLGCCWCAGLPVSVAGIICGSIGMRNPNSKGMAVAGLILSGIGLVLSGGLFILGLAGQAIGFAPNQFNLGR